MIEQNVRQDGERLIEKPLPFSAFRPKIIGSLNEKGIKENEKQAEEMMT